MLSELPLAPKRIGSAVVASLRHFFPQCFTETERQGIEPFSCCDPRREEMCDQVAKCPYALGLVHRKIDFELQGKIFVGYGDDFVVIWWKALPPFTQLKKKTDVAKFFESLTADS